MDKFLNKMKINRYMFDSIIKSYFTFFVILSFSNFILYAFGSTYFTLDSYKENVNLNLLVSYIFLYFNLTIFCGIVFRIYNKNIFTMGALYYILHLFIYFHFEEYRATISFISPIVFTIVVYLFSKLLLVFNKRTNINLKCFVNLVFWFMIVALFQALELKYRMIFNNFINYNATMNYLEKLAMGSNTLMLQFLIYITFYRKESNYYDGNDKIYNAIWNRRSSKSFIRTRRESSERQLLQSSTKQNERNNQEQVENFSYAKQATEQYKLLYLFYLFVFQSIQFVLIAIVCILGSGKIGLAELILVLMGFWSTRKIVVLSVHFNNIYHCTLFSMTVFFLATKFVPQPYTFILLPIIVGSFIALLLYHLKLHLNEYNNLKKKDGYINDKKNEK